MKAASLGHGIKSSQSVGEGSRAIDAKTIMPLSIIPTVLAPKASGVSEKPI